MNEYQRRATPLQSLLPLLLLQFVIARAIAAQPETILLWPQGAPGSEGQHSAEIVRINDHGEHIVSNVHFPSVTVYVAAPDHSRRTAVIVVPGGGHHELWMDHEGYSVARYLAAQGITAFVLKYRLAHAAGSTYTVEGNALADLQRAIRLVRSRAQDWQIEPQWVGVMGFSAGGELAALAAMHHDSGSQGSSDPIERWSSKPAFQALLYPAIPEELQLPQGVPPAFLLCGADDQPAISLGLADLYLRLRRAGVPAELHIYAGVGHGFGLRPDNQGAAAAWPQQFVLWLRTLGLTRP